MLYFISDGPSDVSFYEVFPPSIYNFEEEVCLVGDRILENSTKNVDVPEETKETDVTGESLSEIQMLTNYSETLKGIQNETDTSKQSVIDYLMIF